MMNMCLQTIVVQPLPPDEGDRCRPGMITMVECDGSHRCLFSPHPHWIMKKLLVLGALAVGVFAVPAQAQYYPPDYDPGYYNGSNNQYSQGYNDGYRCGRYEDCAGGARSAGQYSRYGYSSSGYNRSGYSNYGRYGNVYGRPQSLEGVLIQQGLNILLRSVR